MSVQIADAPEPVHVVALSGCHTLAEKIRYACEHNRGNTTAHIRAWLARYHVDAPEEYLTEVVHAWRAENGLRVASRAAKRAPGPAAPERADTPEGARGFYLVALLSLAVSFDTAWRFFGDVLGITSWERPIMFAVVEAGLIACGYGMRANVRRTGRPGPARFWVWTLCGLAGYMALVLSGPVAGLARVALGPALGLVMLHLALGIEIRAGEHANTTTWARIGRELRERALSRLGLADDERDALARTRDRAARTAARLALARFALFRRTRLNRNLARSGVAHDPTTRARMLAELAALRHAGQLAGLDQPSPWQHPTTPATTTPAGGAQRADDPLTPPASARPQDATVDTPVNGGRNGDTGRAQSASEHPRRRTGGAGRTRRRPARRPLELWVSAARPHLPPEVRTVTPAWVRSVVPDCPHSTSKNVADVFNQEIGTSRVEVTA